MAKKIVDQGKSLVSSKTFWFNVLWIAVTIAGSFGFADFQPDDKVVEGMAAAGAIVNILLRLKTGQPIRGVITPNK